MTAATATPPKLMTVEEFLALPNDGVRRWLIRGQLREDKDFQMTKRNRFHSRATLRIGKFIDNWLDLQPEPRGAVYSGEVGWRLPTPANTSFGVDVLYISAEALSSQPENSSVVHGIPTLVVEVMSPSNRSDEIDDKLDAYLEAGVPLVWIANPRRRTILAYRPDAEPVLFTASDDLTAEPHLPGFRVRVASLFE